MLKNILTMLTLTLFIMTSAHAADSNTYGKRIDLDKITKVSEILDNPDDYVGQPVKIEGMVIEVCAKRGCWVNVASDRDQENIQIKVTDGEIVFPMSATGKNGVFEGIVDEVKLSREDLIAYKKHLAEEKGQPFDPASVQEGLRFIRIIGLGAEIEK